MDKHELNKNKRTGLLERKEHDYTLRNVSEPELFRGIYDYDEVPKVVFNDRKVPMNPAEEWWITDTTFRDGQQSTAPLTVKQITDLFKLQHKLGGKKGLIRASEFFLYSDKDKAAVRLSGAWLRFSRNNKLDSRQRRRLQTGKTDGN